MWEWTTHNEPTREDSQQTAWFWFVVGLLLPLVVGVIAVTDKNAEFRELNKERSRLQLELHNREAIIGTMEETIRELRKKPQTLKED